MFAEIISSEVLDQSRRQTWPVSMSCQKSNESLIFLLSSPTSPTCTQTYQQSRPRPCQDISTTINLPVKLFPWCIHRAPSTPRRRHTHVVLVRNITPRQVEEGSSLFISLALRPIVAKHQHLPKQSLSTSFLMFVRGGKKPS